jgi:DNA-binding response OmpR family regulator
MEKLSKKMRVLIAEDDKLISYLLKHIVDREGFEVIPATDGRKASELIDSIVPPDIVLLDLMMPFMDGFELIEKIKGKDGWDKVPILVLTSRTDSSDVVRALDMGASDYVAKPFEPEELVARIKRYLRN